MYIWYEILHFQVLKNAYLVLGPLLCTQSLFVLEFAWGLLVTWWHSGRLDDVSVNMWESDGKRVICKPERKTGQWICSQFYFGISVFMNERNADFCVSHQKVYGILLWQLGLVIILLSTFAKEEKETQKWLLRPQKNECWSGN